MSKKSISWNIKKYRYFVKAGMSACAELELQAIRGKIARRHKGKNR
jgi:hypothetical protein